MVRTKLLTSTNSQVIQLPKSVAYPDTVKQVDIVVHGSTLIISPAGESWDSWFDGEGVSDDFMESREQPEPQGREAI